MLKVLAFHAKWFLPWDVSSPPDNSASYMPLPQELTWFALANGARCQECQTDLTTSIGIPYFYWYIFKHEIYNKTQLRSFLLCNNSYMMLILFNTSTFISISCCQLLLLLILPVPCCSAHAGPLQLRTSTHWTQKRMLGGPHSRFTHSGEGKIPLFPCWELTPVMMLGKHQWLQ
jgi:hypothetical protein